MNATDSIARLLLSLGLNGTAAVSFRNRLINGNFAINQRGAPDDPTVYEPGAFIRDRWQAGPGGCTAACKVAPNGDTTIHIGAGSVLQVVEGSLYLSEGGSYCLSWQGSAIGRVVSANKPTAFVASPVVTQDLASGADAAVEFTLPADAKPVSLRLTQLEPGLAQTVFERRDDEATRCRRYFRRLVDPPLRGVLQRNDLATRCGMTLSPPMRKAPRVELSGPLHVFDGTAVVVASSIGFNYSTAECIDLDLFLWGELEPGRPAVIYAAGQGGLLDADAEMPAELNSLAV